MSLIVVEDDSSDDLETMSEAGPSRVVVHETNDSTKSIQIDQEALCAPLTMDETSYDDAETIDTADNSNDDEDKPLLDLMKHLINYNGKQNTQLTNNQLVGILKKEFDLDVANLHFISVDIYMNVLKKFLKDWPQWDEFDQVMHETRCMNDNDEVEKMLQREYAALKEYLTAILKACKPFAKEAAQKLKRSLEIPASSRAVPGDVIMEINCTRDQLNTLFFRKPHPEYKSTIFNIDNSLPSKITLHSQNLQSMLNSCYVNITINMACFKYKRECLHNFKHTLVNKKLRQLKRDPPLNTHLQLLQVYKNIKSSQLEAARKHLKLVLEKIQRSNKYGMEQQYDVDTLFETVAEDFNVLSDINIDIPSTFRYYMSKYPYIRHLYKDVKTHSDKYDLQLEEKITPMLRFHITKLSVFASAVTTDVNWIKLECTICQIEYHGVQGIEGLKYHFREAHQNEPNWACSHCDKEFAAEELAAARWHHLCDNVEVGEHKLF